MGMTWRVTLNGVSEENAGPVGSSIPLARPLCQPVAEARVRVGMVVLRAATTARGRSLSGLALHVIIQGGASVRDATHHAIP
jgi:hypothetical protein